MILISSDDKRLVEVGSSDIWQSIYATAEQRLGLAKHKCPLAIKFLQTGACDWENAEETARQINILRDELSRIPPSKAVYDLDDIQQPAPWAGCISRVVTSCANLYTTSDGKDLLYEMVSILCYASAKKVSVSAQ